MCGENASNSSTGNTRVTKKRWILEPGQEIPLNEIVLTHGLIEGNVEVIVRPYKYKRSNEQNRYYWGVVVKEVADHTGYSSEEVHEMLKSIHLQRGVMLETRKGLKEIRTSGSTATLKTGEMEEYLSKCRQWASVELGIYLPEPNEVTPVD